MRQLDLDNSAQLENMESAGGSGILEPTRLVLDQDTQAVLNFERTTFPDDTEPIHTFPGAIDEIVFDEPNVENVYPTTEPPSDFYNQLDLTVKEFTGDVFSKPISLLGEAPLLGEVQQTPVALGGDTLIKQSVINPAVFGATESKGFNLWLLLIIAAVIFGVFYLSKNKIA